MTIRSSQIYQKFLRFLGVSIILLSFTIGHTIFADDPTPTAEPTNTPTVTVTPSDTPMSSPTPTDTPTPTPNSSSGCTDTAPGSTPQLISAVAKDTQAITLTWKDSDNPVSYYLLSYGLSSGKYIYGNPNIGGQGTTSTTVGNLSKGTTYYFVIRAGNGCAPGNFSNEISGTTVGGIPKAAPTAISQNDSLENTDTIEPTEEPTPTQESDTMTPTPNQKPTSTPVSINTQTIVTAGTILGVILGIIGIVWFIKDRQTYTKPPQE